MYYWVQASSSDFTGTPPQPRSGHTAVSISKSKVIVFGGFIDKKFLNDIFVYDTENKLWFQPECTGSGSDGQVGPSPRAFHVAVAIDCHMFIFGGRTGSKRLGDFWVLDTDIWQWSELTSFGDLPSPRDFAAFAAIGNQKIVMYGGWDGKKWLSDVYVLDTISLEWMELSVTGTLPPPRCGHTATMVEKRLLVYGGRGGGGPIMGDLWALKGLIEGENEAPGWTQLKLPGQAPSPRCGHTVSSGGVYLLLFGGHGTGGWLSRYDIYYNDCVILDRMSAQWKRLPVSSELPPARAYHSMTSIGTRHLLFGGFDGKTTFGDLWWLVPEDRIATSFIIFVKLNRKGACAGHVRSFDVYPRWIRQEIERIATKYLQLDLHPIPTLEHPIGGDPIAKRPSTTPPRNLSENTVSVKTNDSVLSTLEEKQVEEYAFLELQKKLEISVSFTNIGPQIVEEVEDKEFCELGLRLIEEKNSLIEKDASKIEEAIKALRNHWKNSNSKAVPLKELGPLLRDYQRIIFRRLESKEEGEAVVGEVGKEAHRYYHLKDSYQLRMDDIPKLLAEYKELLSE